MAKLDGADGLAPEDKGQLNYHVILIGTSLLLLFLSSSTTSDRAFPPALRREHALLHRGNRNPKRVNLQRTHGPCSRHLPRQFGLLHASRPPQASVKTHGAPPLPCSLSSLNFSNTDIAPLCRTSSRRSSAPCTRAQRRLRRSQTNRRCPRPRSRRSSGNTTPRTFARRESPLLSLTRLSCFPTLSKIFWNADFGFACRQTSIEAIYKRIDKHVSPSLLPSFPVLNQTYPDEPSYLPFGPV